MGKTYVFWRTHTGAPYGGDDGKYAPVALLERLGTHLSSAANGGIAMQSLWIRHDEIALRSAVAINDSNGEELNETDAASIIWGAISAAIRDSGGGKPILPNDFRSRANALAATHFRQPVNDYLLSTSMSIATLPTKRIRLGGCTISQVTQRGAKSFGLPEALDNKPDHPLVAHFKNSNYARVKVKTAGRSAFEAADRALSSLNLLRGLWTFIATRGSWSISFGATKPKPIGVIHVGPLHTLHTLDGRAASDFYWYEPDYSSDHSLYSPKESWSEIEKDRRIVARRISGLPYRRDLENVLRRYALALDHTNLDVAFLQMWSILEKLTDTVGANYDETIKRTVWIYEDRDVAKERLEHLRFRRNQYVHAATSTDQRDQVAYMTKSFVEPHLIRLINNPFKIQSFKEYGEFLGQPTNCDVIRRRRRNLALALRFHSKKPTA